MPRKTSRFHLREGRGILERLRAAETMLLPQVLVGGTPGMTPSQDQPLVTTYHRRHQAKCWPRVALDHGYMILQRLLTTDCNKNRSGKLEKKHPEIPQCPGMFLPTPMVFQAGAIHQQFFTAPQQGDQVAVKQLLGI